MGEPGYGVALVDELAGPTASIRWKIPETTSPMKYRATPDHGAVTRPEMVAATLGGSMQELLWSAVPSIRSRRR